MALPIFIQDDDQPTTCSACGSRTDFDDVPGSTPPRQHHTCIGCGMEFLTEEEPRPEKTKWIVYRRSTLAIHVTASSEEEAIDIATEDGYGEEHEIDAEWSAEEVAPDAKEPQPDAQNPA